MVNQDIKIAVVGDVHDLWDGEKEEEALRALNVDLVLFVGDFGNENVGIVEQISQLNIPKAVILGNHDAWYTASAWGRKKAPYDHNLEDRVQEQLDLLGASHVGYGKLDFPHLQLSVVGSRPFSWGGLEWKNEEFLRERFAVNNFAESTQRIVKMANSTTESTLIFLGHNGPYGLGDAPDAICGKDWQPAGGDHGDGDFTDAIQKVQNSGKKVPLVTFGHMHHRLRYTDSKLRTIIKKDSAGTVYLNAASVPRIISGVNKTLQRHFCLVTLHNQQVTQISQVWLGENCHIQTEEIVYQRQTLELEL